MHGGTCLVFSQRSSQEGIVQTRRTRIFFLMADGAVEEQFPQPIVAAEEAQVVPGQEAPAPQPAATQPDQNEEQNVELEVNYLFYVFGFWLVHNLGVSFHSTLRSCLVCYVVLTT